MFSRPFMAVAAAAAVLSLAACEDPAPKTSAGGIPLGDYVLVGLGGRTVPLRDVTLRVEENRLSGHGPCNRYTVENNGDLPALQLGPISSSTQACAVNQDLETSFFQTLQSATSVEYYGGVLKVKAPQTWLIFERGVPKRDQISALDAARGQQGLQ
ncbi:META domain-containing protein [Paracoccus fistulariae]|uniref:META domain-containing protein n=1 Tax=Paracoccus fistulariae TaxID=658446 RepID=A0ABY7SHW8_9RHOB|nr:META domain-containing protein [Paracoccus fistulariae]MDB6182158.1 META domain-containing protein [Paracoccus fistulariae]WCR06617.1 META domain-containing protein [Paracoccus fistulariae]